MKNTILALTLFFFISIISSAQKFGIKAGGNFTNVMGKTGTGDKVTGHQFIPGFHVGILGELDVAETISLQAEAVYSRKGFRDKSSSSTTAGFMTVTSEMNVLYTLSYVDVPLLVNIHFGQMASYIGLGPQLSFLMGAKYDGTITNTSTNTATSPPVSTTVDLTFAGNDKTGYSKVDFGAVIGTGSKWDSGIEYCIRAGYGLGNVIDPANSKSTDIWHNLVFSVSIGYTFGTGGGGGGDRYGHKYNKPKRRH